MAEIDDLRTKLVEARHDEKQARENTCAAYDEWVLATGPVLRSYLLDQAKTTATKQASVTEARAAGIPALRASIAALADAVVGEFTREFEAGPIEASVLSQSEVDKRFAKFAETINRRFAELMTGAGYSPGDSSSGSRHPGLITRWGFYREGQSGRVFSVPSASLEEYRRASYEWSFASTRIAGLESDISRLNAASIWGD